MTVAISRNGVGDRIGSREHIRTMRMRRHLIVAGLSCVASVVVALTVYSFFELVLLAAFVGVVLGSLARALDARLGYWWGWLYGEPEYSTRFDLLIDGILRRLAAVQADPSSAGGSGVDTAVDDSRVRILSDPDSR